MNGCIHFNHTLAIHSEFASLRKHVGNIRNYNGKLNYNFINQINISKYVIRSAIFSKILKT